MHLVTYIEATDLKGKVMGSDFWCDGKPCSEGIGQNLVLRGVEVDRTPLGSDGKFYYVQIEIEVRNYASP